MMPQRISKKILLYLFIFFSLVTINNKKYSNNFYKIKYFNISGLDISETNKIYKDLINFKNNNIFFLIKNIFQKKLIQMRSLKNFKYLKFIHRH